MNIFNREYSIRKITIIVFLFIMATMFYGFYGFYRIGRDNLKNYQVFIKINKQANGLVLTIDKCEMYANTFFNTNDENVYREYSRLSDEIDRTLKKLGKLEKNEKELLDYFDKPEMIKYYQEILYYLKTLKSMNKYQKNLTGVIAGNIDGNEKTFKQIEYLTRYFREMDSNAKLLIKAYFNFTGIIFDGYYEDSEKKGKEISIAIMIMSGIGFLFLMDYLYRLLRNVRSLEGAAKALSEGDWQIDNIKKGRYREFNQVARAFDDMKHAMVHYVDQLQKKAEVEIQLEREKSMRAEKDKLLKETKLLSLQMRMNPHFLFNTLNLIGSTAIHADIELATELIEAISNILRYNLEFDETQVELEKEIDILEKYVFIQEARWQNRIKFTIENNVERENVRIYPMLIQPLIENCIIHGFKDLVEGGVVKVAFQEKNESIEVSVFDNGSGIKQEEIEKVYEDKSDEKPKKKRKSIGLKNIRKRLEMIYKKDNLLEVHALEKGTLIKVIFPFGKEGRQ